MSAPSMMSSAWLCSAARARASCGFWCASLQQVAARWRRLAARSSLSSTVGGAQMQLLDGREPRQPERFARDDDDQRQRRDDGEGQAEQSRGSSLRANRSSIRWVTPSPRPSSTSPPSAVQNSVPQRKPRARRDSGASIGDRQQGRIGFRRDVDRAARRAAGVRRHPSRRRRDRRAGRSPGADEAIARSLQSVSDQELEGAVEADVRQRGLVRCRRVRAAAAGSAGSGNRSFRPARWRGRETHRRR